MVGKVYIAMLGSKRLAEEKFKATTADWITVHVIIQRKWMDVSPSASPNAVRCRVCGNDNDLREFAIIVVFLH